MQFISIRPASWAAYMIFTSLAKFLDGHAFVVNFAVPGRIDPDRGFRAIFLRAFVQDDYRWKPNLTLIWPKIRVRHSPHRSKREISNPPQHFRLCHGHWGPLVRQPGTEGLCAEKWLGLGSVQEWKDFGAIWVWDLP